MASITASELSFYFFATPIICKQIDFFSRFFLVFPPRRKKNVFNEHEFYLFPNVKPKISNRKYFFTTFVIFIRPRIITRKEIHTNFMFYGVRHLKVTIIFGWNA